MTRLRGHAVNDVLRLLVVVGVVLALVIGAAREQTLRHGVQRVDDVVTFTDAAVLLRSSVEPPDMRALDALAGMAATAPLLAALPPAPRLTAELPQQLVAGRAAGLTFSVVGTPGARERVQLIDGRGIVVDSADQLLDAQGRGRGAFRVRPARQGWHEWSVRVAGESNIAGTSRAAAGSRTAGAWVLPERAPRVLLAAGPPSPESRFTVRALEETGAVVEIRQPLGHGLTAGAPAASLPLEAAELAQYDVVMILHGAVLDPARRAALVRYVAEHGGGLLLAARDPLLHALGLAAGEQPAAGSVDAGGVTWSLPAELVRLPGGAAGTLAVASQAEPLTAAADAFAVATAADGAGLLVLRGVGHGRAGALGLRESWRWRVAAGRADEHREFWRSLVDWLAPLPDARVETPQPVAAVGLPVPVDIESGSPLPPVRLRRPGRESRAPVSDAGESLAAAGEDGELLSPARGGGAHRDRFVFLPTDTGVFTLVVGGREIAGLRIAESAAAATGAGALLALLADASGGHALPADELAAAVRARAAALPVQVAWRLPLLLLLLGLAVADWALRRLRGAS
jgi:hypothetical protein